MQASVIPRFSLSETKVTERYTNMNMNMATNLSNSFIQKETSERRISQRQTSQRQTVQKEVPEISFASSLRSKKNIRLLETAILSYITICTLWFSLNTIVIVWQQVLKTPFKSFPFLLRAIGVLLIAAEIILVSPRKRAPHRFLLYGICLCALISSIIQIKYGFRKNFQTILQMLILFSLFYGSSYALPQKRLRRYMAFFYGLFAVVWFAACSLSLIQYVIQLISEDPGTYSIFWIKGTGFVNHRLTGIFTYPEYGSVPGVMLMMAGLQFFLKTERIRLRVLLVILNLPVYLYLVLCGSRNAALAFFAAVFIGAFLLSFKYCSHFSGKGIKFSLILALAVLLGSVCFFTVTKQVAEFVSVRIVTNKDEINKDNEEVKLPAGVNKDTDRTPVFAVSFHNSGKLPSVSKSSRSDEEDNDSGMLRRTYRDGDFTTGRLKIWRNYFRLWKEIGLFGLSPENTGYYVQEHHPKMYIVTTPERLTPAESRAGYVFHPHNGYIKVYSSAGFIGLFLMIGFFSAVISRSILWIRRNSTLSLELICTLLVLIAGASSALFDMELFFVNNPPTFLFWLYMSFLFKITAAPAKR